MSKKLLIVFTGGTISTEIKENVIVKGQKTSSLLSLLPPHYSYDLLEPFDILSENMTTDLLFSLFRSISDALQKEKYHGVLITHGTDTLAYTAQLAALLLGAVSCPVILLGSKYASNHPQYDGQINFTKAIQLLSFVSTGVYVVSHHFNGMDYVYPAEIGRASCRERV